MQVTGISVASAGPRGYPLFAVATRAYRARKPSRPPEDGRPKRSPLHVSLIRHRGDARALSLGSCRKGFGAIAVMAQFPLQTEG